MDLKATEKKIRETEAAIRRDLAEADKAEGMIRRYQEKKKTLEIKIKENRSILSDLQNRRTVLTIESRIGTMDDGKLALLTEFLGEHGDAFEHEGPAGKEEGHEGEKDHASFVGA